MDETTGPHSVVGEVLLVAERVLGKDWEELLRKLPPWVYRAAPDAPTYSFDEMSTPLEWVEEVTLYCARIIRDRPFGKRNLKIGYETLRMLLEWAKVPWPPPRERNDEIAGALEAFEAWEMTEAELVDWVCSWVGSARQRQGQALA